MLTRLHELWRRRNLVATLAARDLNARYRGSALGLLWSLTHPLALAVVYTIAVRVVLRVQIPNYALFVLAGLLPWIFFSTALTMASGAITDQAHLVKKVPFPREALPIASVSAQFVHFTIAYLSVALTLAAWQVGLHWAALALPVLMVLLALFTTGLALVLSAAQVYVRDTRHLLDVAMQILFWLTPIIYSIDLAPEQMRPLFAINPLAPFVGAFRTVLIDGATPTLERLAYFVVVSAASFAIGYTIFLRGQRRFAEYV